MAFKLSEKSLKRLEGVDAHLIKVIKRAIEITPIDFVVIEGLRTKERQAYLLQKGATKTMNSRHITGHAVDIAPIVNGQVSWDWAHYRPLAVAVKQAAKDVGVDVEWGGDFRSFPDGPHWQLPRS